ncbi:ribonuclease H-like domain-containing protein [Tanacetum coccineum]
MDLETAQTTTNAKFPIPKQENGNSFKPVAQTTTNADGISTLLIPGPITTEEKVQKKNDVKARSMLLMALSNEHLMTFNQYKDAKTLFAAIQIRFCGFRRLNKPDLDIMNFDDLYNNFKIVIQEVKKTASSSSSSQNMAFVSSPSSTNEVYTAYGVSTANTQVSPASTQVSTASTQVSTANLSDATVYAFLASQPNKSQLVHENLKQIHKDDLEEMDLKWQLELLSMKTIRFFQKTGRKITINGSDTTGYDKSKVECFNCHNIRYFARECRGPRNQDSRNRNQDSSRWTVNVEETSSKAMVAIDEAGFDWSYMADNEVPTNMTLMDFLDSEVNIDKTCSKTCLKSFETLKTQLDDLRIEFNKSEFNLATYKRGLASVEEQLVFYKKNELEKLKQEKESNQLKIENFDNASKSLDKLIWSQITNKSRKGVGFVSYNAVPPPHTRLFSPPNLDLSYSSLKEFQQPEFKGYGPKTSKSVSEDISNEVRESLDALLVEELVSDDKLEKKTVFPTIVKIEFVRSKQQEKPVRKLVKYAEMYRLTLVLTETWLQEAVLMKTGLRPLNNDRTDNMGHLQKEDQGYVDSGCLRHMTGNMSYLLDFKDFDRGYMYKKKKNVLFTDTRCFVLSPDFKLADESQVLLKVPRKNNMYSVDMKNIIPKESLTCLVAKSTLDESILWHRSLGIKKEFSVARTPQQNGVAERRNKTLIEAARTMLADSKLPITFWAEAFNTACYVQNRKDGSLFDSSSKNASNDEPQPSSDAGKKDEKGVSKESEIDDQERPENSTQDVNTDGQSINTEPDMFSLGDIATLEATHANFFSDEIEVDMSNITTTYLVPYTPNTRIHKDHSLDHVIGDVQSREEPKKIAKALSDSAWVEAMQEELLQFKLQKVWVLVDLPKGKRVIGTKWVFRNKKDDRGIVILNKARLVAQGHTQEKDIDYDEFFVPVARTKAIRLFLAYASFMGFMVYHMDVKSDFLYGRIEEEVYVYQPLGFEDHDYLDKVYKVVKALYDLHQASRAWYETLAKKKELCTEFEKLMHDKFQMSSMGELAFFLALQVK